MKSRETRLIRCGQAEWWRKVCNESPLWGCRMQIQRKQKPLHSEKYRSILAQCYDSLDGQADRLCKELSEYGRRDDLSASMLDKVDTLAHAAKNLDKVIEKCEETGYRALLLGARQLSRRQLRWRHAFHGTRQECSKRRHGAVFQ